MMRWMRRTWWSLLALTACLSKPDAPAGLTVLAPDEAGASELVLDGGDLFWTLGGAAGAIRGCALATCEPRSLVGPERFPRGLLVMGDEVLWGTQDQLRRATRTATNEPAFLVGQNLFARPVAFRRIGSRLYVSAEGTFFRCEYKPGEACVATSTVGNLGHLQGPLTLDPNGLLWVADDKNLYDVDAPGEKINRTFPAPGLRVVIANATYVFALQPGAPDVLAWPVGAPDQTPPTRIPTEILPRALAFDDRHLFVAGATGHILRVPLRPELGEPEQIAEGLPMLEAIAVAPKRLYVIADGRVGWVPKP